MPYVIAILIGLWFWLGDPPKTVANMFWENDAAPWETVDAYYYPNRNDLTVFRSAFGFNSVDDCRSWVRFAAASNNDVGLTRGDFECGVGRIDAFGGMTVYRITTR